MNCLGLLAMIKANKATWSSVHYLAYSIQKDEAKCNSPAQKIKYKLQHQDVGMPSYQISN